MTDETDEKKNCRVPQNRIKQSMCTVFVLMDKTLELQSFTRKRFHKSLYVLKKIYHKESEEVNFDVQNYPRKCQTIMTKRKIINVLHSNARTFPQMKMLIMAIAVSCISISNLLVEAYSVGGDTSGSRTNLQNELLQRASRARTAKIQLETPVRELQPPFPDGLNGGQIVNLPPSQHYDLHEYGNSFILPPREISVWLPPDYEKFPAMKFPVLYVHDGQNAMEDSSSWTGHSWRLAGALTRLAERKLLQTTETHSPPIVVMMPCAEDRFAFVPRRHLEYGDISQTFAQAHADFVGKTLKPLIDSMFRTMPEKENTGVIGSSLGGQASLYLLLRHPDLFGKAACMSPAFQPSILTSVATLPSSTLQDKKIFIDNGGDVDDVKVPFVDPFDHLSSNHWWNPGYWWLDSQLQPGIDAMKLALDMKNIKYEYEKCAGGRHNERAWASRIHVPLLYLFGRSN